MPKMVSTDLGCSFEGHTIEYGWFALKVVTLHGKIFGCGFKVAHITWGCSQGVTLVYCHGPKQLAHSGANQHERDRNS